MLGEDLNERPYLGPAPKFFEAQVTAYKAAAETVPVIQLEKQQNNIKKGKEKAEAMPAVQNELDSPIFKQRRLHLSKTQRIVGRLLPFIKLKTDLWVRFDVPMDIGLERWESNLNGFQLTFLDQGFDHPHGVHLVMAARTNEKNKMEATVMFTCKRDYRTR
jgi:hypothetical protein